MNVITQRPQNSGHIHEKVISIMSQIGGDQYSIL